MGRRTLNHQWKLKFAEDALKKNLLTASVVEEKGQLKKELTVNARIVLKKNLLLLDN